LYTLQPFDRPGVFGLRELTRVVEPCFQAQGFGVEAEFVYGMADFVGGSEILLGGLEVGNAFLNQVCNGVTL
jgi:hypothetical protein